MSPAPTDRGRGSRLLGPIVVVCLVAVTAAHAEEATVERRLALMGTRLELEVAATDRPSALAASERAVRELEAADERLSTWRDDTELSGLNRAPMEIPVLLSQRLRGELKRALECAESTDGAFDPTVGALVAAWGLRQGGRRPTAAELERARAATGYRLVQSIPMGAVRLHPHVRLEEGGWGKGAALDAALAVLDAMPAVRAARLDLGGQVAVLGSGPWRIEIADPRDRRRPVVAVRIDRGSLAVSGNSERAVEVEGRRLGHLLDPRTGLPAEDFGALAVWAPDALTADCLATGLYVAGPEQALAFADRRDRTEVVVLELLPSGLRVRASRGWAGRIEPLVSGVEIEIVETAASGDGRGEEKKRDAGAGRQAWAPRAAVPDPWPAAEQPAE